MNISGLVITLNEEKNIRGCVNSLFKICDEVIVIDSNSIDKTVAIAQNLGAKVYTQPFMGDGPQRSFGIKYCKNDWILNLDADERLDDDLIEQIQSLDCSHSFYDAYEFKRKNILHGKWIRVAGWYPNYVKRLFNKNKTDFSSVRIHTKITSKKFKRINGHIVHYSFENYEDMLKTLNKYSTWQAEILFRQHKKTSSLAPFVHFFVAFIKHYFIQLGFTAGIDGLTISILNALGSYFKYAKLLEQYQAENDRHK